jgi:hypothetical protein
MAVPGKKADVSNLSSPPGEARSPKVDADERAKGGRTTVGASTVNGSPIGPEA